MRILRKILLARVLLVCGALLLASAHTVRAQGFDPNNYFSFLMANATPSGNITPSQALSDGTLTIDLGSFSLASLPTGATLELYGTVANSPYSDYTLILSNFATTADPSIFTGSSGGFYTFLGDPLNPGSSEQIDIGTIDVSALLASLPADGASHSVSFSCTLSGQDPFGDPFGNFPDQTPGPPTVTISAIVSTPPPTTTIVSPANGTVVGTSSVAVTVSGVDAVTPANQLSFQYRLDGGAVQGPVSTNGQATATITLNGLANGAHMLTVAAINGAGIVDPNPPTLNFTIDTLAPQVSNVAVQQITDAAAGITWTTNKPTNSQVQYRPVGAAVWSTTPLNTSLVTSHGVPLTGLTPNTLYEVVVYSQDSIGREATSSTTTPFQFQTLVDTTPPHTGILSPQVGAFFKPGPVIFSWTGADDATPTNQLKYEYQLDTNGWSAPTSATNTTITILSPDGQAHQHTFSVRAIDASGNIDPNPPMTSFTIDPTAAGFQTQPTVSNITFNSATVSWSTNKATYGGVQIQVQNGGSNFVTWATDPALTTNHSVTLGALSPDTTYNLQVIAQDQVGNQIVSSIDSFATGQVHELAVTGADLSYSDPGPASGEKITMTALVHNLGDFDQTTTVVFYDNSPALGNTQIGSSTITVKAHAANPVSVTSPIFSPLQGLHHPYVQLTNILPNNDISTNTTAEKDLIVGAPAAQLTAGIYNPITWPGNEGIFTVVITNTGSRAQTLTSAMLTGASWVTLVSPLPTTPLQPGDRTQLTYRMTTPTTLVGGTLNNPISIPMSFTVSCGVSFTTTFSILAYSQPVNAVNVTVVDDSTGSPIPGATVCMDGTDTEWGTDANGVPLAPNSNPPTETPLNVLPGATNIYAIAPNYLPGQVSIGAVGNNAAVTIRLKPGQALQVTGVTTRQLSLSEIQQRGVNLQDPNNFFVFDFVVAMEIGPVPVYNVVLPAHPAAGGSYYVPVGGGGGGGPVGGLLVYYPTTDPTIHTDIWIVIPGTINILKQFWAATVFVQNNSNYPINNVVATLDLPQGLSLPLLFNQPQPVSQSLGTIAPMQQQQAQWTVRGDIPGTYQLTGLATGALTLGGANINLNASLQSSPITVAKPVLGVSFNTPGAVTAGQPFTFGINITNDSTIDWQLVEASIQTSNLINCHLAPGQSPIENIVGSLASGATQTLNFQFISDVTGIVEQVQSYVSSGPVQPPVNVVQTTYPPPVAVNQTATTAYNTPVTINVLQGDSDPSGFPISVQAVSQGSHGSVTISSDHKTVTYKPQSGFAGQDTFLYTITNGQAGLATATVTVTVAAPTPSLTAISPATATAGAGAVTLTLTGSNFVNTSQAQFNGTNLTTTYVSPTQLTATIPATLTATAGAFPVKVVNPTPGGGTSGAQTFTLNGTPHLNLSAATAIRNADGTVTVSYTISNTGTASAPNVKTTQARVTGTGGTTVTSTNGPTTVSAGGSFNATVNFPSSVVAGTHSLVIYGTLNGASFSLSHSITIP